MNVRINIKMAKKLDNAIRKSAEGYYVWLNELQSSFKAGEGFKVVDKRFINENESRHGKLSVAVMLCNENDAKYAGSESCFPGVMAFHPDCLEKLT